MLTFCPESMSHNTKVAPHNFCSDQQEACLVCFTVAITVRTKLQTVTRINNIETKHQSAIPVALLL